MRKSLLVLLCTLIVLPVVAAPVANSNQAVDLVEKAALPDGRDDVVIKVWGPVSAGTQVLGSFGSIMVTPAEGYVVYIDDYPTANLFHPVRYAFGTLRVRGHSKRGGYVS
jgi:hypothetical protein